jgi:two-component system nitrogen regulation response regulator NtrX
LARQYKAIAQQRGAVDDPAAGDPEAAPRGYMPSEIARFVPLTPNGPPAKADEPSLRKRASLEREYLVAQINRFGGNISRTAEFVGMERSASSQAKVASVD